MRNIRIERNREGSEARIARCNADILRQTANGIDAEAEKLKAFVFNLNVDEEAKFTESIKVIGLFAGGLREEAEHFDEDARQHRARQRELAAELKAQNEKAGK